MCTTEERQVNFPLSFKQKVSEENVVISVATTYPNMHHKNLSQWCVCE